MQQNTKIILGIVGVGLGLTLGAIIYFAVREKDPLVKELESNSRDVPFDNEPSPVTTANTSTPVTASGNGTDGSSAFENRPPKDASIMQHTSGREHA